MKPGTSRRSRTLRQSWEWTRSRLRMSRISPLISPVTFRSVSPGPHRATTERKGRLSSTTSALRLTGRRWVVGRRPRHCHTLRRLVQRERGRLCRPTVSKMDGATHSPSGHATRSSGPPGRTSLRSTHRTTSRREPSLPSGPSSWRTQRHRHLDGIRRRRSARTGQPERLALLGRADHR